MGEAAKKKTGRRSTIKKTVPKRQKRPLPDVRRFAGSIPGIDKWALEEVRRMRDEW